MTTVSYKKFIDYIRENPNSSSLEAGVALGVDEGRAAAALSYAFKEKWLLRERRGRPYHYFTPEFAAQKPINDELERVKAELAAAKAELAEAQAKHPDLVKAFDYEPYRPAVMYLANAEWFDADGIREGFPFTSQQEAFIRDFIVAVSLMPQGDAA